MSGRWWNQSKSNIPKHGEPDDHIRAVHHVANIMSNDSGLAVILDLGLNFTNPDGYPDYHEFDLGLLTIDQKTFKNIGAVIVLLMGKLMSFNVMYKEVEIFRNFIDSHIKLIVEVDGERHQSVEVRIRDGVTQQAGMNKWKTAKFVRLKKADCSYPEWVRERLWGLPTKREQNSNPRA